MAKHQRCMWHPYKYTLPNKFLSDNPSMANGSAKSADHKNRSFQASACFDSKLYVPAVYNCLRVSPTVFLQKNDAFPER